LYRHRLGWLLGHRFACITHRGRRSGQLHQTVLETLRFEPRTGKLIVASAWGGRTDWYRNILACPALEIWIGRHRYQPRQRLLSEEETSAEVMAYFRRHRLVSRIALQPLLGLDPETAEPALRRRVGEVLRGVEFLPLTR
jgi:deazaflavin-dependent oxidoreductase (nitroreductase family)